MNQADAFLNDRNRREDITARIHHVGIQVPENFRQTSESSSQSAKTAGGWFSFSGRAMRKEWWIQSIVANIPIVIFFAVLVAAIAESFENDVHVIVMAIMSPVLLAAAVCYWSVTVRRLHDLGKSGWWALVFIALDASVWLLSYIVKIVLLGCLDGQPFANEYGFDPKGRNRQS